MKPKKRPLASAAALLGAAGGKAGKGKRKVRGGAQYYRDLVARRKDRQPDR